MHVPEPWQRRVLWALVLTPVIALAVCVPLAVWVTSGWSSRLVAIGLAFEIAGAVAILLRPLVEETGFWLIRREADRRTMRLFIAGILSLALGFLLQFVSVVFL